MNINTRMTRSAWQRDRFATVIFSVFVAISVAMISLTAMLFMNLTGAIDHLMSEAKTPDFLQMHAGTIEEEALEQFIKERPEIINAQVLCFLNLDNSILTLGGKSMLDSTQDNGLCVQGDGFDYMIGLDNKLPQVLPGQVYVPVCYESVYRLKAGDVMRIGDKELTVAGFIRDSQMNSMMASSKRFLVCAEDYARMTPLGSEEYLIEFLLKDGTDTNALKTAYENANLPMNGPTITRPLIKMMNTLSDGIMIFIILLISLLVLLISLVCIRFLLLTRVAMEAREVGMLKAVGISGKEIRLMFLRRYTWLILAGVICGVVLSGMMFQPLSVQMQKLYGVSGKGLGKYTVAICSAILIAGMILGFVLRILRRLNAMTAVGALTGTVDTQRSKGNLLCITVVTALAAFLMMIPTNLHTTLSSPEFVTYMGIGDAKLRMDMREGEGSNEAFETIEKLLAQDKDVQEYALYRTCSTPVRLADGTTMNMLMEQGDHTSFPVTYHEGRAPQEDTEVALSYLLAQDLGLNPGDTLDVKQAGEYVTCTISGIYSDITNGGKTAKIFTRSFSDTENVMWRIAYVTLSEGANQKAFVDKYTAYGAEVVDIVSRIMGTYGPTLMQVERAAYLVKLIASVIIVCVILLFVRMILANRRNSLSIQKALGFTNNDLKRAFRRSCAPYVLIGIVLGAIGGCTLGELLCGVAISSLGAVGFQFTFSAIQIAINIVISGAAAGLAVYLGSRGITNIEAVECCRGRE